MSRSIPASGLHHHALGVAMVAASAVVWSTAGIFTKAVAADVWRILFWRGLFGAGFVLVKAIGVILLTEGVRLIPASDAALLGTLEVPLAPVLAWLILSETVPVATITGGSIVAVALFWYLARGQDSVV